MITDRFTITETINYLNNNYFTNYRFALPSNIIDYVEYEIDENDNYYLIFNLNMILVYSLKISNNSKFEIETCIIEYVYQFIEVMNYHLQYLNVFRLEIQYTLILDKNKNHYIEYKFIFIKSLNLKTSIEEDPFKKYQFLKRITTAINSKIIYL